MKYPCSRFMAVVLWLGAGAASGLGAGCGLISSDVTNFDLTLPEKKFTIDASRWNVAQADADPLLALPCSSSTTCESAVVSVCPMGCSGACNASSTCDLALDISLSQPVDLVMETPELKSINDEPVIKVTIDSVTYQVTSNSLNVATPTINVYVGATSVVNPTDPTNPGTLIGTIPPIAAGATTTGPQMLMFTPTGKAELIKIMSTFKTPFKVLVGSSLLVTRGQPVPTGKLESAVLIKGHAGL